MPPIENFDVITLTVATPEKLVTVPKPRMCGGGGGGELATMVFAAMG